jgi:FtsZ-binding cell division protein ZapB
VFTIDREKMWEECLANGAVEKEDSYGAYLDLSEYKSPDPANVKNMPHARLSQLHAADLVDDPAATDGMFAGASGLSLAAQMTEWLDTHPGILQAVNDEPELLNIVTRYADELKPFLTRYTENLSKQSTPPPAEPGAEETPPAEPGENELAQANDRVAALMVELNTLAAERDGLTASVAGLTGERDALKTERDELTGKLTTAQTAGETLKAERDALVEKLAAILTGKPPLSAVPAEGNENNGSLMQRARKAKSK